MWHSGASRSGAMVNRQPGRVGGPHGPGCWCWGLVSIALYSSLNAASASTAEAGVGLPRQLRALISTSAGLGDADSFCGPFLLFHSGTRRS